MKIIHFTYVLFSFLLILMLSTAAFGQQSGLSEIPADSSEVEIRTVDIETLQQITEDRVFEYNEIAQNPDSFMSRIYRWLMQVIQYIMGSPWAGPVIRFIFLAIFALVLIGLINQILGGNLTTAFSKKKASESISLNIKNSELLQTDYDALLKEALSVDHYHDAVRILYLKALQQLNEAELITLKADKTNHDYVRELSDHPARTDFTRLTYYYEYVEYGDFQIEKKGFENVQDTFRKFQESAGRS
jgi:acyl-CoA-binding protein